MATNEIRTLDLFCGAGGSSWGAQLAGASIVGGIDAWGTAIDTFKLNYPTAKTWNRRIENLTAKSVRRELGRIDLLLASPECTNHTFAKGNRRVGDEQEKSRQTAFQVVRFAGVLQPRWLVVENVVSMRQWAHYPKWKRRLESLGYHLREMVLNAQDFGVPQSRRRLFVVCDLLAVPQPLAHAVVNLVPVTEVLQPDHCNGFNYKMSPLYDHQPCRAADTIARAARAIESLGKDAPFLIVYYGTDAAGGWQALDRPLRTITTLDRFALVRPTKHGHVMRMLQPPELAKAMGFPEDYRWPEVTRRERIKLVGNAVAPPVMKAVVNSLLRIADSRAHSPTSMH